MTNITSLISSAEAGRCYTLGKSDSVEVIFRADGEEIGNKYAVAEWWMEPGAPELGSHVHEANDELIYVLEGEMTVLVGSEWTPQKQGSLVYIPAGTAHGFRNDSSERAGILNIFTDGAYEAMMPQVKAMFANL